MTVKIKLARANGALVSYPASAPTIVTNAVSELITQYSNTATVLQYDATTYANAVAYVDGKSYVNTSQLSSNLANYQTTAGLASNVAVLAANSAGFLGNSSGTIANVSSWITSNAGAAYTNAVSYVDGKAYVNTAQLSSNLANYQTTAGLAANVATLAANSATYANASISNTFTIGTATYFVANGNVGIGTTTPDARLAVSGTANVSGNVVIGGALTSANLTTQNIGVGANIQLTTTQLFVGNSTVNINYSATEVFIRDTTTSGFMNSSMMSVGSTIVNTSTIKVGSTTANNTLINTAAINVIGQVNAATINITGSAVIGGVTTHNANVILGASGLSANGGFGTAGQLLNSNGSATYWAADKATNAYSNAVSYVDGKAYVNTSQLSSNLANYALLTGATFTGNVRTQQSAQVDGNLVVSGNLTVTGNVTVIGANNLSVVDNMIYLNSNSAVSNPDLGFAANYNDGIYHHAGFFRDASDGIWKVFDSYLPEPDASPYIDTTNSSFHIANFQANIVYVGNTTVYSTVNTTSFSGTSNNATFAYGKTEGNLNANNALTANSSTFLGTANLSNIQTFITSNAATAYTNAVAYVDGKSYVNTSQLSSNLANYQTTAGLASNVATLAANSATYANASISNIFTIGTSTYFISNGNVGIGTNAPESPLHIKSIGPIQLILEADSDNITETDNPRIVMKQDGGAVVGRIGYANNTNDIEVLNEHPGSLHLGTANTIRITADAGGNVGIGTTTPDARLAVSGTANVSGNVVIGGALTSANLTTTTNTATFGNSVYITGGGIVGIGTSSPSQSYKLTVAAAALASTLGATSNAFQIYTTTNNVDYINFTKIRQAVGSDWSTSAWRIQHVVDATSMAYIQFSGNGIQRGLTFGTDNAERMRIDPSGNVGIGNTTPDAKLAITGTANISGNVVIGGVTTLNANVILGTSGLSANGGFGSAGQVLTSSGDTGNVYWSTASGGGGVSTGKAIAMAMIFG